MEKEIRKQALIALIKAWNDPQSDTCSKFVYDWEWSKEDVRDDTKMMQISVDFTP